MQRNSSLIWLPIHGRGIAPVKAVSISPYVAKNGLDRIIARLIFHNIRGTANSGGFLFVWTVHKLIIIVPFFSFGKNYIIFKMLKF
jgi:hypothetical protein